MASKRHQKVRLSWYEKIDKKFAIKYNISRFNTSLTEDGHRPCIACGGIIRITKSMQCASCHGGGGEFVLIYRKSRQRDIIAHSYLVTNKHNVNKSRSQWAADNKESVIIRRMISRLMNNWKGNGFKAEALVGYTAGDLRKHLESKFSEGMSWNNYGMKGWHIDHIKPVSVFVSKGVTSPSIINALTNLQPLWASDNLKKGSKYLNDALQRTF